MSKPGYVSPVVLAGELLARARAGERISKQVLSTAQRIAALPAWVADKLVRHKAPYRVARWVAWGEPEQRADLALILRRARPTKGWPDAGHLKVAFDVYLQARATGLGGLGMLVSDVPIERYTAAVDVLPKRRRVARRRLAAAAEESTTPPPTVVGEDDVLRALVATRRPRRARPPMIRLRTAPLRLGAPAASPSDDLERARAENARLRAQREEDELEDERHKDLLRREIARLTVKAESLERELKARSGGPPTWLVGLGGVAAGAVANEIVRRGVEPLQAGDARGQEEEAQAQVPDERPTAQGGATAGPLDGEALLGRLLPVFDNLSRAQRHAEEGAPAAGIAEGLRMVLKQLDEALAQSGVDRVPTVGHLFDPARHAAVDHVKAPEATGVVLREELPGYVAGGRLLRAPRVVVSKGTGSAATVPTRIPG